MIARFLRKSRALFALYLSYMLEYRAEIYLWVLASVLPLILLGVWAHAAESGAYPLSRVEFIRYFIAVFVVRQFSFIWVIWEFEDLVVTGNLSQQLLQPIDPVWRFVASHITERVVRLPLVLGVVAICFGLYREAFWLPSWAELGSALVLLALAFAARFALQYMMSMLAFWSERAASIEELWFVVHLFLSGLIAPLDVYPESVRRITELTPFPYLIYYPVNILLGRGAPFERALIVLALWGGLGFVLQRFLWRRGLRRYSAMGN
ncbi:MAG TPA: ABC-2 family transporter protein [Polyangiaceae bacterium]|nr:ABC-2 family transporter protein [Polyangiaceae bacterium]